ncbi:MAG: hypothetical protein H6737_13420 [Alphaproteobacteria bacterium]|nr:hypothetical protein [Alphaproteobacteria bacterium]
MARTRWFHATCPAGLEGVLADEITRLGGLELRSDRGGVGFRGAAAVGYAVALWSRVAMRVLEELERGRIQKADDVYAVAQRVPWQKHLRPGQTFAVTASARSGLVKHPHYVALKVKDAIADQLRDATGARPDVDTEDPDLPLVLYVKDKVATLSRDLAGTALHKRGYRPAGQHKSPLNESLAAGLLLLTGWDRRSALCDPLCGSATFLIEAAFLAGDRAPGLRRPYALERWADRDRAAWDALKADAEARWKAGKANIPPLFGNDRHPGAIALAKKALGRAEVDGYITLAESELAAYTPPVPPAVVVTNPPYGERLDEPDLEETWRALGGFLHDRCHGATAWVLTGSRELTRHLHLKAASRTKVFNGPLECRWLEYRINP